MGDLFQLLFMSVFFYFLMPNKMERDYSIEIPTEGLQMCEPSTW